jgi:hypothetical protein
MIVRKNQIGSVQFSYGIQPQIHHPKRYQPNKHHQNIYKLKKKKKKKKKKKEKKERAFLLDFVIFVWLQRKF